MHTTSLGMHTQLRLKMEKFKLHLKDNMARMKLNADCRRQTDGLPVCDIWGQTVIYRIADFFLLFR